MNSIDRVFAASKERGRCAVIIYLTAGYPDIESTEELVVELSKRGVDIVELGIPFSDPIADGPTIQESSQKALANKTYISDIFRCVSKIRARTGIPLVLMTYYNPVYAYGVEKFIKDSARLGIDGLIIPDLPPEESSLARELCDSRDISLIFLVASNTPEERMRMIARASSGFIYCLSRLGITGAGTGIEKSLEGFIKKLRKITEKPLAVGFGISAPEQASVIGKYADGVIVGSAVIDIIRENIGNKGMLKKAGAFAESFTRAAEGPASRKR